MKTLKKARSNKVQTTVWIKFKKGNETVKLPFNSRMMEVHDSSDLSKIVDEMIAL